MRLPDNLNYEVSGDRRSPAVLFLHGFMGSSADWREVMAALGDRAFCVAADLPGHGASLGLSTEAYTIEGSARAVINTLDRLEVEHPVVVGYSMGGRRAARRMGRRRSASNRETSKRFLGTGTASRSSRLWRGMRTCSIGSSRRAEATSLESWRARCGAWGSGTSPHYGENWKVYVYLCSPSPGG